MVVSMTAVGPVGTDGGLDLAGGAGGVGKSLLGGWGRLCLRGYAEGQGECENTKRHAVFDSNKQANADARLEQCGGAASVAVVDGVTDGKKSSCSCSLRMIRRGESVTG